MVNKLRVLLKRAYSPYSYYRSSAIVVTRDDKEYYGVNVENSSYSASICAERNAIFNAVTHGYTRGDIKKLYVMVDSDKISFPCHVCRQVFTEFLDDDTEITCYNKNGESRTLKVKDLCTYENNDEDDIL